jgi:hypothetical protein
MSAADWAKVAAIAAIAAAVGTFLTPLFALQISAWLSDRKEKFKRKLEIFQILMQWRMATFCERPVQALNVIDALFYDVKPVREAWAELYTAYNDQRLNTNEGGRIRQDKMNALLREIAAHLGYARWFSMADFERVYNPELLARFYLNQIAQTNKDFQTHYPPQQPPQQPA